ncbi:MAG: AI-2E family transporter [Bradyrhizobiaceae bacterium]|nr:AI-2E family transporter [Bradyrhizobiaceae bacterium]
MSDNERRQGQVRVSAADLPSLAGLLTLAVSVVTIAALYLARDLLIPLTLAVLLSFVLAPLVRLLRRARLPWPPAVLIAVLLALAVLLAVGGVIGAQIAGLADDLPRYETTIRKKIDTVQELTIGRVNRFLARIDELRGSKSALGGSSSISGGGEQSSGEGGSSDAASPDGDAAAASSKTAPTTILEKFLSPVLSPLATLGIVLVITLFILLQRDDLRDRFIRLVGARDLHRTTVALDEAVKRLSKYFLAQLALNTAFGVVIAVGLYFIGLPSPVLWGVVAGLCRFIPYIGAWIAAAFPLVLAAAVDPSWSTAAWTLALFVVAEPVMGQVIEPVVYGHSTGLSPVSVVVATIFWTWLWGPIGLILATPLTLCLVVLGRHVDRLEFLDVLLGDRPALSPIESFYQRMLAGDPDEAQDQAELLLRTRALSAYYDDIALKGLKLAAEDASREAISMAQLLSIRDAAQELVDELDEYDDAQPAAAEPPAEPVSSAPAASDATAPPEGHAGDGRRIGTVLCVPGVSPLDEAASAMLAQLLAKHGLAAQRLAGDRSSRTAIAALSPTDIAVVCISALETGRSHARLRLLVRRLRRRLPGAQIMIGLWAQSENGAQAADMVGEVGADRCVVSLAQAVRVCLDATASAATDLAEKDLGEAAVVGAATPPLRIKTAGAGAG